MFSAEDKALIRTLYAEKHVSIRCIAQMVHVSRNAVRRQIREEGKARAARSAAGAFLKEHAIDVQELYLACEMRCPPLRRRLNKDYQWDEGTKNGPDRSALLGHNFVYQETKPHGFYSSYFHQRISS